MHYTKFLDQLAHDASSELTLNWFHSVYICTEHRAKMYVRERERENIFSLQLYNDIKFQLATIIFFWDASEIQGAFISPWMERPIGRRQVKSLYGPQNRKVTYTFKNKDQHSQSFLRAIILPRTLCCIMNWRIWAHFIRYSLGWCKLTLFTLHPDIATDETWEGFQKETPIQAERERQQKYWWVVKEEKKKELDSTILCWTEKIVSTFDKCYLLKQ
jgi:hypothetical protein